HRCVTHCCCTTSSPLPARSPPRAWRRWSVSSTSTPRPWRRPVCSSRRRSCSSPTRRPPSPAGREPLRSRTARSRRRRRRSPASSSSTSPTAMPRSRGRRSARAPPTAPSRSVPPPPRSSAAPGRPPGPPSDRHVSEDAHAAAAATARDGYGRLVAMLAAADGDLAAAEDAVGDALERALATWPERGLPENPAAWLLTVARNRRRDRWESAEAARTEPLDLDETRVHGAVVDEVDPEAIGDHRLELMLVCAHPAVDGAVRTPLMLNTVLGFTAEQ